VSERNMTATPNGTKNGTNGAPPQTSHLDASLSPFLNQLTAGLGEQIKAMATEAAGAVVAREKEAILSDFRAHLQDEATKTLERVMAASKEELASQAFKEHEAAAQTAYERWFKKIDQDLQNFSANMQQTMNSSRREAVEQFRSQTAPVLGETQAALQKLATVQDQLKVNLVTMCQQFEDFLQQGAAKSTAQMQEKIAEFARQFDDGVNARVATAAEQAAKALKDSTAEISRRNLSELESRTRAHLEFISQSIAEIAKKGVTRPSD
jgi:hypothetical protein